MESLKGDGYGKAGKLTGINNQNRETIERLVAATAICSDTIIRTSHEDESKWKIIGNPTEAAILIAGQKFGMDIDEVKNQFERTKVVPFSSDTKTMTVMAKNKKSPFFKLDYVINFTKGDPVKVLSYCRYIFKEGKKLK